MSDRTTNCPRPNETPAPPENSRSTVFDALSHRYRRHALRSLSPVSPSTVVDVARYITATTEETDVETVSARLHHVHLPKLAAAGLLEYRPEDGTVRLSATGESARQIETVAAGALKRDD